MCLNSNDHLANTTLKWTAWKWTHSILICGLFLMFSKSSVGTVEFKYPPERNGLVNKDNNTLLNPTFLPFLNDCGVPTNRMLCATYYDMVYNVYQYDKNVAEVKAEMHTADQTFEKLGQTFCQLFPTEIIQALDKQPFLDENHINLTALFRIKEYCTINCITMPELTIVIKPICKFISGGCKWILKQKHASSGAQAADPKIIENESTKLEEKQSVNNSNSFNDPIVSSDQNVNNNNNDNNQDNNQDTIPGEAMVNENKETNVNEKINVEPIPAAKINPNPNPNFDLSSNQNPISNVPMPDSNQILNSNPLGALNVSKPSEPVLTQQVTQKDDKKGTDPSLAPKSTENRPSSVSGNNKPSQNKDTNTEPHENNASDNIIQNENNGDDNGYKSELDDPERQEDDTEQGRVLFFNSIFADKINLPTFIFALCRRSR